MYQFWAIKFNYFKSIIRLKILNGLPFFTVTYAAILLSIKYMSAITPPDHNNPYPLLYNIFLS